LEDANFKRLAANLPATVLHINYLEIHQRWKECMVAHNLPVFPVNEGHGALYLQHLAEVKCSKSIVKEAA